MLNKFALGLITLLLSSTLLAAAPADLVINR